MRESNLLKKLVYSQPVSHHAVSFPLSLSLCLKSSHSPFLWHPALPHTTSTPALLHTDCSSLCPKQWCRLGFSLVEARGLRRFTAYGILIPWAGIKPTSLHARRVLNRWNTSEAPVGVSFDWDCTDIIDTCEGNWHLNNICLLTHIT